MKIKENIFGIAELLSSAVLTAGSVSVFAACGEHEGKYMACHWAQNAVTLIGALLVISALIRLFTRDNGVRAGIAVTQFLFSAAAALIPGTVINLCMMETMRCHTIFKPAVIIIAVISAAVSGADAFITIRRTDRSVYVPENAAA